MWDPSAKDAATWAHNRVVRAAFLRHLLLDKTLPIELTGARVDGDLRLYGGRPVRLALRRCVLDGTARFLGTTFTGHTSFAGTTFTRLAEFVEATFDEDALFRRATFCHNAYFRRADFRAESEFGLVAFDDVLFGQHASFNEATFGKNATFNGVTFQEGAEFKGAAFSGDARFGGAKFGGQGRFVGTTFGGNAEFVSATFTKGARFSTATFRKHVEFSSVAFGEDVVFSRATFGDHAWFDGATFGKDATFDEVTFHEAADFKGATFSGEGRFGRATFCKAAAFNSVTFPEGAEFIGTTFSGDAWFAGASFSKGASFCGTTFSAIAMFYMAVFAGDARFTNARFRELTVFDGMTCSGHAKFELATFAGDTRFCDSRFRELHWAETKWSNDKLSTTGLAAVRIVLDGAVVEGPVRFDVIADEVSARRLRALEPLHLVVAGATVNLADADLVAGSSVESAPVRLPDPPTGGPYGHVPEGGVWVAILDTREADGNTTQPMETPVQATLGDLGEFITLDRDLSDALTPQRHATIVSLRGAHLSGVTLCGMDLRGCTFAFVGAAGEPTIAGSSVLARRRDGLRWPWKLRRTEREVIADEFAVRGEPIPDTVGTEDASNQLPAARAVSAAYRSLRITLESNKDWTRANDFYFGEMEMRRISANPVSVERFVLATYWLVSGYGMRACRAVTALAVIIGVASMCFIRDDNPFIPWEWVRTPSATPTSLVDPHSALWPLAFAAQETIALLRPTGAPGVTLVGFGLVIDIIVRLAGLVLLVLAGLAVRSRIKR
ncbi:hypothetical protein C5O27_02625 [Gordonia alkanivorans]|nr:hypothetical protein C5O27_02625 [Gordonia alkanivorans]